ncbi:MAG: hypothetical protein VR69_15070 [Peptococcaceae bacterium BRH_c4b]|nr:MAG: hypothetical protein VR69_15070 [Peptococcaceae bacterium BRH_c4b]
MSGESEISGSKGDKYCPPGMTSMLADRIRELVGQQATVYMYDMVLTGMVHYVGMDYMELHVMYDNMMRMVLIPLYSVMAVVPGGPLPEEEVEPAAPTCPSTPGIL